MSWVQIVISRILYSIPPTLMSFSEAEERYAHEQIRIHMMFVFFFFFFSFFLPAGAVFLLLCATWRQTLKGREKTIASLSFWSSSPSRSISCSFFLPGYWSLPLQSPSFDGTQWLACKTWSSADKQQQRREERAVWDQRLSNSHLCKREPWQRQSEQRSQEGAVTSCGA